MKRIPKPNRTLRRYDSGHRRLTFERFEERLTLAGTSIVPAVDTFSDGGFIAFDAGEYLSPSENVFLVTDSSRSLPSFDLGVTTTHLIASTDPVSWGLVDSNGSFFTRSNRGVEIDTLRFAYTSGDIGTVVPVMGADLIDVQLNFRVVSDTDTSGATFDSLGIVNTVQASKSDFEGVVHAFNGDDAISTASEIVSDITIKETIADVASQSVAAGAAGHTLRFHPGGTFTIRASSRGELTKLFTEGLAHSNNSVENSLRSSETILTTIALRETTDSSLAKHVSSSVVILDVSLPTVDAVKVLDAAKSPRESAAVVNAPSEVPQVSVDALPAPVTYVARSNQVEATIPKIESIFTSLVEGGPIEVTGAVNETQRAYEAEVFSTVAALLNDQDILARPTPPIRQPFSGELARSVAFETVHLEPTAVPADLEAVRVSSEAAAIEIESESEASRSLAFAQWPLVFSATVGAVFMSSRRRGEPTAS